MTPEQMTLLGASVMVLLAAVAYLCARKSGYHRAKSDCYRELAELWGSLRDVSQVADERQKAQTRQRAFLMMALCPSDVRDAMWDGLNSADAYWNDRRNDPHPRRLLFEEVTK